MKKFLFFIATALLLFIIDISPGSAGEPLKIKWKRNNVSLERICRPGKLVVVSDLNVIEYLIDLITGEIIYQTNPSANELGIYTNYSGDKYYVSIYGGGKDEFHEYDTKSKQFIRTIKTTYIPMSPTDESGGYSTQSKSFVLYNAFTRELIDSIYYPIPFTVKGQGGNAFTVDNKYFLVTLYDMDYITYFYLFDRTTKEFIIKQKEKIKYCMFNKSNKIAFAEMVKLEGDDTVYSYIRIYDPDLRQYVQNIKIGKVGIVYLINRMDDNYVIYTIEGNNNPTFIYDYNKNKIVDNDLKPFGSPISYVDSNLIVTTGGPLVANIYDWSTGIKENNQTKEDMTLYPNPVNNQITVNIAESYYNGTWKIVDLTGKIMLHGVILPQNQLLIDISRLMPQTYYLTIRKENNSKTFSIIKR